jgi:hypothetical protein
MIAEIIKEVYDIIKEIVKSKVDTAQKGKKGCPALYFLYQSISKLQSSSESFIQTLQLGSNETLDYTLLQKNYEIVIENFLEFGNEIKHIIHQLEIFNPEVSEVIRDFTGVKMQRINLWTKVLDMSKEKLRVEKKLIKLKMPQTWFSFNDNDEVLNTANELDLNDDKIIQKVVDDAKQTIENLNSLKGYLAEFIKQNCSFADLYP